MSFAQGVAADPELEYLDKAVCPQTDPEAFFPDKGLKDNHIKLAKAICHSCVSLVPCREGAVDRNEPFGIWGGTTREDRRKIRKERKQQGQ